MGIREEYIFILHIIMEVMKSMKNKYYFDSHPEIKPKQNKKIRTKTIPECPMLITCKSIVCINNNKHMIHLCCHCVSYAKYQSDSTKPTYEWTNTRSVGLAFPICNYVCIVESIWIEKYLNEIVSGSVNAWHAYA